MEARWENDRLLHEHIIPFCSAWTGEVLLILPCAPLQVDLGQVAKNSRPNEPSAQRGILARSLPGPCHQNKLPFCCHGRASPFILGAPVAKAVFRIQLDRFGSVEWRMRTLELNRRVDELKSVRFAPCLLCGEWLPLLSRNFLSYRRVRNGTGEMLRILSYLELLCSQDIYLIRHDPWRDVVCCSGNLISYTHVQTHPLPSRPGLAWPPI